MPKIHVHKAFNLLLDSKTDRVRFEPGIHDNVSDEVANHWYTKEHASVVDGPEPQEPVAQVETDQFDAKSDDELRAFITERDSKAPHHRAGREKLLAAARGDAAASAEVEAEPQEPVA